MPASSANERRLIAQIAAEESWAATPDRAARTEPARRAFRDKFLTLVDPSGSLDVAERTRRAEHLRRAHYARLALASAQARRERARRRSTSTAGGVA